MTQVLEPLILQPDAGNHDRDFADSGDRFNNATYQYSYDRCGAVLLYQRLSQGVSQ